MEGSEDGSPKELMSTDTDKISKDKRKGRDDLEVGHEGEPSGGLRIGGSGVGGIGAEEDCLRYAPKSQ
jgi:hypothetical protein